MLPDHGILMRGRLQPEGGLTCKPKIHILTMFLVKQRIRQRRTAIGLSQKELGSHLDVSFQQIPKYEKGFNHVGAGRLQEIANILAVPITFFYADITTQENNLTKEHHSPYNQETYSEKEHALLRNFRELHHKKTKSNFAVDF